jgi:DNA-binding CsgD family transcriptional regulator
MKGYTDLDTHTATAVLTALRLAREHGSALAALAALGIELPSGEQFGDVGPRLRRVSDIGTERAGAPGGGVEHVAETLALGFLAGRIATSKRARRTRNLRDPTSFLMDRHLVVQAAEGESILRLPWFDDGLFVGRQLPDILEIPSRIRSLAVESYLTALGGEQCQYSFSSYGHAYSVDAIPVRNSENRIDAVLAIALPSATRDDARRAGGAAHMTGMNGDSFPSLTPRELEVLELLSHGLSYADVAAQLVVSVATVKSHLANAYDKLNVRDKAGAVAAAMRLGLFE